MNSSSMRRPKARARLDDRSGNIAAGLRWDERGWRARPAPAPEKLTRRSGGLAEAAAERGAQGPGDGLREADRAVAVVEPGRRIFVGRRLVLRAAHDVENGKQPGEILVPMQRLRRMVDAMILRGIEQHEAAEADAQIHVREEIVIRNDAIDEYDER